MRLYITTLLLFVPALAYANADEDRMSYVCDHDNAIEIVVSQDKPDDLILNAFSKERVFKRVNSEPVNLFKAAEAGYEISFEDLNQIFLTTQGVQYTCNLDSVE